MEGALIVIVLTVFRLGVPVALLLLIGEVIRRHEQNASPRGA